MDTGIKGYRDTVKQRYRETEIQGYTIKDTLCTGHTIFRIQETGIQG